MLFLFGGAKHKCQAGLHVSPSHDLSRVMTLRSSIKPGWEAMTGISGCLAQPCLHYRNYQCSCRSWDPVNDTGLKSWAIYTQRNNFYKVNDLHGTSRWYCSRPLLSTHLWNSSWWEFWFLSADNDKLVFPNESQPWGCSSQLLHTTFLSYLGEAVISRLCFSCIHGAMKKKRLKKKKMGRWFRG